MNRSLTGLAGILLTFFSAGSEAFFDPPAIIPSRPTVNSFVSMSIRSGICDTFLTAGPEDRELEVVGNRVTLRVDGYSTVDTAQCIFPSGTRIYSIGTLPPGAYQLELFQRDVFIPTQLTLVGTATFEVSVGNSVPIPAVGWPALIALGAVISGLSLLRLRTRNPAA